MCWSWLTAVYVLDQKTFDGKLNSNDDWNFKNVVSYLVTKKSAKIIRGSFNFKNHICEKLMPLKCVTTTKGGIGARFEAKECENHIIIISGPNAVCVHIRIAGAYNSLGTSLLSLPPLLVHKMNSPNGSRLFQFSRRCSLFFKNPPYGAIGILIAIPEMH